MNKIEVLIVVDAAATLASRNLVSNVYMVDTNKFLGSWNEGQCNLHTVCANEQNIAWSATGISESNEVQITKFSGQMTDQRVCLPENVGTSSDPTWEGRVETQGQRGRYTYTVTLSIDGASFTFSPFLDVQ